MCLYTHWHDTLSFSGHIHPGVKLKGLGKQHLTFSCFYKTESQMLFLVFGKFTSKYIIKPQVDGSATVTLNDVVVEVNPTL